MQSTGAGWMLAANSAAPIPAPPLSRCRVIHLQAISRGQLLEFAAREIARRQLAPDLIGDVERLLGVIPDGHDHQLNLRTLISIVAVVRDIRTRPVWQ